MFSFNAVSKINTQSIKRTKTRRFIMKFHLIIFIIGLFNVIPIDGRLIQKNKTRNAEDTQTENPNPFIRLTRDIENDSSTGLSKEDSLESDDFVKSYNKRAKNFSKSKPKDLVIQAPKRSIRDSSENDKVILKTKQHKQDHDGIKAASPNAILVKKPIPKFSDMDYDDFQSKMSSSHVIADSVDHEDEDFNLGDYDFDVNHDEFISEKLLEPRTIIKNAQGNTIKSNMKIINKVLVPEGHKTTSNKKQRAAKETDYYDDTTTPPHTKDYEHSDENDDSKDLENKSISTDGSWNIHSLPDNSNGNESKATTKVLSALPLFPQIPK